MKHKLEDIKKVKPTFSVPERYFEELPLRIQDRLAKEEKPSPMWLSQGLRLAIAASMILAFFLAFYYMPSDSKSEQLLAEVPESEIIAYLDQLEIDEYDIASAVGENTDILQLEDYTYLDEVSLDEYAVDELLIEYNIDEDIL